MCPLLGTHYKLKITKNGEDFEKNLTKEDSVKRYVEEMLKW